MAYIHQLLAYLEELKKDERVKEAQAIADPSNEGRTLLTRYALMLFARADDEERAGKANVNIVRLFFTAACLLEATAQFTDDKQMDAIAAAKAKYAKYTAARMKKCLDAGEPYVSRNTIEPPVDNLAANDDTNPNANTSDANDAAADGFVPTPSGNFTTAPPSSYLRKPLLPSVPAPAPPAGGDVVPYTYNESDAPPPPYTDEPLPPISQPVHTHPVPQQGVPATYAASARPGPGQKASVDAMIDAQKFARQAVNALSFQDTVNARKQLLIALDVLNGKPVPPAAAGK
ncbi:vacuolar protein sorting-associated protein VTA1 [Strigomonas culicis]|uniref:Vacuolar protein sorting-associated protein VTA1 n=1 Tax=Strigomonas culicis TaxID=28005 RepID=S9UI73_9TRYP|nr:vacuolar protein sorting-associated protein VTA1 [Strigomonas culicis]|eukprot:EPY30517.1 vacuolar protein sorting-associated protein VTA1 [Strigomonas culicis]